MPSYTDEGVVLRTIKLGEADRIVTILTRRHGKIRAVAKGVRKTKSRFGGRLEPFMRDSFLIHEGRQGLDHINQVESINAYAVGITDRYDAYVTASVMVETVDKLLDSMETAGESLDDIEAHYLLLIAALSALSVGKHTPELIGNSFVLRILSQAGWTMRLDSCVVCGRHDNLTYFSVPEGGMMCSDDRVPSASRIAEHVHYQLAALLAGNWSALYNATSSTTTPINLDPRTVQIVEQWLQYYIERPVRSLRLVESPL